MATELTAEAAPAGHPILLLSLAAFFSVALLRACDPLVPEIARSFDVSIAMATVPVTAYVVAYGLGQLAYGPLGGHIGTFKMATIGCSAAALLSLACAFAISLQQLIAARALAGLAAGAIIPMAIAFIGENVAYADRQRTLARFMTGGIFGLIAGFAFAGFFAQFVDWRYMFAALSLGLVAISAGLWRYVVKHPASQARARVLALPHRQYGHIVRQPWPRIVLLSVGVEGFFVFGVVPFVAVMLADDYGLDNLAIGAVLSCFGLGSLAYAFAAGRIVARLGEAGCARLGGGMVLAGYCAMALTSNVPLAIVGAFAAGMGYMMLHNTLQTNATQMVPSDRSGAVSLFAFCLFVGQALGVMAFAALTPIVGNRPSVMLGGLVVLALGLLFAVAKQRAGPVAED